MDEHSGNGGNTEEIFKKLSAPVKGGEWVAQLLIEKAGEGNLGFHGQKSHQASTVLEQNISSFYA